MFWLLNSLGFEALATDVFTPDFLATEVLVTDILATDLMATRVPRWLIRPLLNLAGVDLDLNQKSECSVAPCLGLVKNKTKSAERIKT